MSCRKRNNCMRDLELFSMLNEEEKNAVITLAKPRRYKKNEFVFRQGEKSDRLFFIRSGKIRLFKLSPEGKTLTLGILKEDDVFGENTIFDEANYTFSAQAMEECFVCECTQEDFMELLKHTSIAVKMIKNLTDKMNGYTEQMANIAFNDVRSRVIVLLEQLAREHGSVRGEEVCIDLLLSHQDIANLINASRVMVSNVINGLKSDGLIHIENRVIHITGHEMLETVLQ